LGGFGHAVSFGSRKGLKGLEVTPSSVECRIGGETGGGKGGGEGVSERAAGPAPPKTNHFSLLYGSFRN